MRFINGGLFVLLLSLANEAFAVPKVVIAHRSASGYLPEHTLPSVAMAHTLGVDFIEPDVVLTKDGVPVILHDIHLEATTDVTTAFPERHRADGRWYAIDFTLAEIRTLNVGERRDVKTGKVVFPSRFPDAARIFKVPTLEEEIQLVQGMNFSTGRNVGLYPELKSPKFHRDAGQDISKVVLALLARYDYRDKSANLYLQCFDATELKRLRTELKSTLKLIQLIGDNTWGESDTDYQAMQTEAGIKAVAQYADGIGPWIPQVIALNAKTGKVDTTPLVKWAHAAGMAVHPYTIRIEELPKGVTLEQLHDLLFIKAGVDGVFSDFADKTLAYLTKRKLR